MGKTYQYFTEFQTIVKQFFLIALVLPFLLSGCSDGSSNDPSGEWRMAAVQRQAPFGNRADRINIPEDAQIPVYFHLLDDGSFSAESSRRSTSGQWCLQDAQQLIVLKSTDGVEDTLRINGSGESLKLVLSKRTHEGTIEVTYAKD